MLELGVTLCHGHNELGSVSLFQVSASVQQSIKSLHSLSQYPDPSRRKLTGTSPSYHLLSPRALPSTFSEAAAISENLLPHRTSKTSEIVASSARPADSPFLIMQSA